MIIPWLYVPTHAEAIYIQDLLHSSTVIGQTTCNTLTAFCTMIKLTR